MNPFPWHPVDLGLKLALAPYAWFDPVLEWYTPPSDFSHGTYFGLARWGHAGDRCGYLATQDFHGEFRECEFPLEELEALEKTLKAISIPLGSSARRFRWWLRTDPHLPWARRLDRLFLSQYRAAAVGSAFGFHPRNDRTVPAVPAG